MITILKNCNIQGGNYGVFSGALNDSLLRIKNNEIYNFKLKGVALMSVHGGEISSNNIHRKGLAFNNSFHGIDLYQCSDLKVLKNRIHNSHDNASPSALSKDAEGIHISTCFSGAGNEILVANNLIYRLNNKGLTNGIHIDSSSNVQVYYNTISLDENLVSDGDVSGIKVSATGNSSDFKNNIISIERGGNSRITGININGISPFPAMDYNDVYINAYGSGTFNFGRINGNERFLL